MNAKYGIKFSDCIYNYPDKYFCFQDGNYYFGAELCIASDISDIVMFDSAQEAKEHVEKIISKKWYASDLKGYSSYSIVEISFNEIESFNF